jgi:hypothetical protein
MSAANCTSRFRAWSNPTLHRMFDNRRSTFHSSIFRQAEVLRLPSGVHATSSVPDECVRGYVRPFCGGSPLPDTPSTAKPGRPPNRVLDESGNSSHREHGGGDARKIASEMAISSGQSLARSDPVATRRVSRRLD